MYVSELQSDHEFNCQLKEEIENKINEGRFRCLTQRSTISQLYHGDLQLVKVKNNSRRFGFMKFNATFNNFQLYRGGQFY